MYQLENIYSFKSYKAWTNGLNTKANRESSKDVLKGDFWEVGNWDELREAISFLSLMNKRLVLYYRGQKQHYDECLPVLFRSSWYLLGKGEPIGLDDSKRLKYLTAVQGILRKEVFDAVKKTGTPREYIIKTLPAATASILQHYELWPTHFLDLTRSLPISVSFSISNNDESYLYVFGMPDLRGSITNDYDQHIILSRLEAVCPPKAKRPHHQDAYLVTRTPMPSNLEDSELWNDWTSKIDLMRRLVAKFRLSLSNGGLLGTPLVPVEHLIPPNNSDQFAEILENELMSTVERLIKEINK